MDPADQRVLPRLKGAARLRPVRVLGALRPVRVLGALLLTVRSSSGAGMRRCLGSPYALPLSDAGHRVLCPEEGEGDAER